MAEGDGKGQLYRVIHADALREDEKAMGEKAALEGRGPEFAASLKALNARFASDPSSLGEPLRDLKHLGLQVRLGNHGFLFAHYAVDEARHLVYVLCYRFAGQES
jgi:hypothetical protein